MLENSSSNSDFEYNPNKRIKFLLMGLLFLLNIIIRVPSIPHEKGYDSFFIHLLSNSISTFGEARWWISWLSVFGFYPDSYASAVPYTLSGISQVMGLEMEKAILLYCIFIGIFGMYVAYIFAGRIYNNFLFKYMMSLIFSLAPGFMLFTTWEVSTRGQFVTFLPLFIYILLKEELQIKNILLMVICAIFIFSTHHYAFFLVPIAISYISLKIIHKLKPEYLENQYLNYMFILLFIASLMYPFFSGMFIEVGSRYAWVREALKINLRQVGVLILILPGGLVSIFLKKKKLELTFMCFTLILLAPIFYSQTYGPFILIFFCTFLIVIALYNVLKAIISNNSKFLLFGFTIMILTFVSFGNYYNHFRTGNTESFWYMEDNTYTSGIWAKNFIPNNTHGLDSGLETVRFYAISEGHPITISLDPVNLAYGWINENDIKCIAVSPLSLGYYFDGPYVLAGSPFSDRMEWLRKNGYSSNLKNFDYLIVDKEDPKNVFKDLESNSNLICDGPRISIWKN